jgi:hypothetical protein
MRIEQFVMPFGSNGRLTTLFHLKGKKNLRERIQFPWVGGGKARI